MSEEDNKLPNAISRICLLKMTLFPVVETLGEEPEFQEPQTLVLRRAEEMAVTPQRAIESGANMLATV
jgi:hypothetical protein